MNHLYGVNGFSLKEAHIKRARRLSRTKWKLASVRGGDRGRRRYAEEILESEKLVHFHLLF